MKKNVIRAGILFLIFLLGVVGFSCLMNNQSTDNKTDLETAAIPCMAMKVGNTEVNRMYGYAQSMDVAFMRDTLTPLGTDKSLSVSITPYGQEIESLVYEVRTADGDQVVENNKIRSFQEEEDGELTAEFTLQKSILMNQEYALVFTLNTDRDSWTYYTRVVQRAGLSTDKYVEFVDSFYTKTFSKDSNGDLRTYLEPETTPVVNFRNVNINSSLDVVTWGEMAPELSRPGIPAIKEINENTGSVALTYYISAENEEGEIEKYQVDEFYRMSYDQTRVRLLDFQRSVKQVITTEQNIVSGGMVNLGITSSDVVYKSDSNATVLAFVQQGDLWTYNVETNKMTRVFSFRDTGSNDERNDYDNHGIKIIRVTEEGDVDFILYGYMNRGTHGGEVGTGIYHYSSQQNAVEEQFFLKSKKAYEFLKADVESLSYVTKKDSFYLLLEGNLYCFHMEDKTYETVVEEVQDSCIAVSENNRYTAWMEGMNPYDTTVITFLDMETGEQQKIQADQGTRIRLFGFINNDLIYGVANESDIVPSPAGGTDFAMKEIRIQNSKGELVKSYQQEGYYVTDVTIEENLVELTRAQKMGDTFVGTLGDQIMNNVKSKQDEVFSVITSTTVRQGNVTSIEFAADSSGQAPLVVESKFMEKLEDVSLDMNLEIKDSGQYYVYAKGGLWGIYENGAQAVQEAEQQAGVALDSNQQYLWERSNTKDKSSISVDAIPEAVKQAPLDVQQLNQALEGNGKAVDLTGCTLEQILYQVSAQRPVIVKSQGGQAMVLVGYDSYNTILYNPVTKETSYMGMQDSTKAFQENGNVFICYMEDKE